MRSGVKLSDGDDRRYQSDVHCSHLLILFIGFRFHIRCGAKVRNPACSDVKILKQASGNTTRHYCPDRFQMRAVVSCIRVRFVGVIQLAFTPHQGYLWTPKALNSPK